jgi:hypothetical protein
MSRFSALEVLNTGLVPAEEASHQQLMGLVVDKLYTQSPTRHTQLHPFSTAPLFFYLKLTKAHIHSHSYGFSLMLSATFTAMPRASTGQRS